MFNKLKLIKVRFFESSILLLNMSLLPGIFFIYKSFKKLTDDLEKKKIEIIKLNEQISEIETRLLEETLKKENIVDQSSSIFLNTTKFMSENSTYIKYILIAIILVYIGQIISYKWLGFPLWKYLGLPSIANYFGLDFSSQKECDSPTTSYDFTTGDFNLKCKICNNQIDEVFIKNLKTDINYIPLQEFLTKVGDNSSKLVQALAETLTSPEKESVALTTSMVTVATHPIVRQAIATAVYYVLEFAVTELSGDIIKTEEIRLETLKDKGEIHNPLNDDDSFDRLSSITPTRTVVESLMKGEPMENNVNTVLLFQRIAENLI